VSSMQQKERWLVGGIFGGIGLIFVAVGWALVLQQSRLLARAVEVQGEVLEAYVETATSVRGPDSHVARVRFQYVVRDTLWTNDRVLPHEMRTSSRKQMRQLASRFPVGSAIPVWVDPEDAERAFLLKELLWLPYVIALAPMLFVLIGAAVALPAWWTLASAVALLGPLWWHHAQLPEPVPLWMQACYAALLAVALIVTVAMRRSASARS